MQRAVTAHLEVELHGPTTLIAGVAVADGVPVASERLHVRHDGAPLGAVESRDRHGSRLHTLHAATGILTIDYEAIVAGSSAPPPHDDIDPVLYLRPSRYCESDALLTLARSEFAGLEGQPLLDAVVAWVADRLEYTPGVSGPTDGARDTLQARAGVCRDYAHVVIALLRALDVPARMVAAYAPGLEPMDFHAVVEAWMGQRWWLLDATHLAPRTGLVRIATGRDAADVSFLTSHGTDLTLRSVQVDARGESIPSDLGGPVAMA